MAPPPSDTRVRRQVPRPLLRRFVDVVRVAGGRVDLRQPVASHLRTVLTQAFTSGFCAVLDSTRRHRTLYTITCVQQLEAVSNGDRHTGCGSVGGVPRLGVPLRVRGGVCERGGDGRTGRTGGTGTIGEVGGSSLGGTTLWPSRALVGVRARTALVGLAPAAGPAGLVSS